MSGAKDFFTGKKSDRRRNAGKPEAAAALLAAEEARKRAKKNLRRGTSRHKSILAGLGGTSPEVSRPSLLGG